MLDDTSLSGTCDLQKRRRIMPQRQHHLHFRAKERFAQAPATCDWTLRCSTFVRRTRVLRQRMSRYGPRRLCFTGPGAGQSRQDVAWLRQLAAQSETGPDG